MKGKNYCSVLQGIMILKLIFVVKMENILQTIYEVIV